jgi:hypothetical protein
MAAMGRYVEHQLWSIEFQYTVDENLLHQALTFQWLLPTDCKLKLKNSWNMLKVVQIPTSSRLIRKKCLAANAYFHTKGLC